MCRLMGPVRVLTAERETSSHQHHTTSPCLWTSDPMFGIRHVTACGDRTKESGNKEAYRYVNGCNSAPLRENNINASQSWEFLDILL